MRTRFVIGAVVVVGVVAAWMLWSKSEDRGRPRFFADQTYNFQTLRALDDVSDIGGDTGETLQTVAGLKAGDVVTSINSIPVTGSTDLTAQVRALQGGSKATIDFVRGGRSMSVKVTLGTLK